MGEETTPQLHKDRNKILVKYAEHSFSAALDEINEAFLVSSDLTTNKL